jgi:hypothetical protein
MSAAYLAMVRLEAAGVQMLLTPDGRMLWRAPSPPPHHLLANARQHRDAIRELLRLRLADIRRAERRESAS